MSYRTLAERPGDAPPEVAPVVVLHLEEWAFFPLALLLGGRTRIELDAEKKEIRVTPLTRLSAAETVTWRTRDATGAERIVDERDEVALGLVMDGVALKIANGHEASCDAAVITIAAFLDGLHKARAARIQNNSNSSELFKDWEELTDAEKWECTETLLARVPVDADRVLRRIPDDVVDLRGTQGGFLFHIQLDPTAPQTFELELAARQPMGDIDLSFNAEMSIKDEPEQDPTWEKQEGRTFVAEHIFISDPEETASFRALPDDLQAAIVTTMEEEGLLYFRIGPKVIEVAGDSLLKGVEDPTSHLSRVLATAVRVARYLSALPFPALYDDHHAYEGNFHQDEEEEDD